jgi:hypothetical protein
VKINLVASAAAARLHIGYADMSLRRKVKELFTV